MMVAAIGGSLRHRAGAFPGMVRRLLLACLKSTTGTPTGGAFGDLSRTKAALVAENAPLRQQPILLRRMIKRPALTPVDRLRLPLLARLACGWCSALLIVRLEAPLRWHRQGFLLVWRVRSAATRKRPRASGETVAPIRRMAAENRRWGAEWICGLPRNRVNPTPARRANPPVPPPCPAAVRSTLLRWASPCSPGGWCRAAGRGGQGGDR